MSPKGKDHQKKQYGQRRGVGKEMKHKGSGKEAPVMALLLYSLHLDEKMGVGMRADGVCYSTA